MNIVKICEHQQFGDPVAINWWMNIVKYWPCDNTPHDDLWNSGKHYGSVCVYSKWLAGSPILSYSIHCLVILVPSCTILYLFELATATSQHIIYLAKRKIPRKICELVAGSSDLPPFVATEQVVLEFRSPRCSRIVLVSRGLPASKTNLQSGFNPHTWWLW